MKRLLQLGETEIRGHWTLLPALALLIVTAGPLCLALGLAALLLHETGHLLTARGLGCRVRALELWPFGAALEADVEEGSIASLRVALAGPLCNLAAAGMSLIALRYLRQTEPVMAPFFRANLSLAAVNLLPAFPLDGGRALAGLLARSLGAGRARRITAWIGVSLGGGLLALGVYGALLGMGSETALLFAAFLLFSGGRTLLTDETHVLCDALARAAAIRAGRPLEVREAVLAANTTVAAALGQLRRGRYTLLRVVDGGNRVLGTLDEGMLSEGALRRGGQATLGELIFLFDRERRM